MYYKSLRVNLASWHDNKCVYSLGKPMPPIDGPKGEPCGPGYHLAKRVEDAVGYGKFPLMLCEAEPCGDLLGEDSTKARFTSAKITRIIDKPAWVIETENFISSVARVKFFPKRKRAQRKNWKVFPSRAAAYAAAYAAARAAACDAALMARMAIVSDLKIDPKHRKHAHDRWEVWTRGYGLACDVNGVLYVYRNP